MDLARAAGALAKAASPALIPAQIGYLINLQPPAGNTLVASEVLQAVAVGGMVVGEV